MHDNTIQHHAIQCTAIQQNKIEHSAIHWAGGAKLRQGTNPPGQALPGRRDIFIYPITCICYLLYYAYLCIYISEKAMRAYGNIKD